MSDHLYIHIPFCLKKCRYCDFFSVGSGNIPKAFVDALVRELRLRATADPEKALVKTLYFGGGTPSLLPLPQLEVILGTIHQHFPLAEDAEITLEVNPGTLGPDYLRGLRTLGVNRLSLGIQSFDPARLKFLGRIHDEKQGMAAIAQARNAGFHNLGLDLIFGLPEESATTWEKELQTALSFVPEHLSCYMLSIESGTPLYRAAKAGRFFPMRLEEQVARFCDTSLFLEQAGFRHYEVSNFARGQSRISRHNAAYWQMKAYDGFGPAAHSYGTVNGGGGKMVRFWNVADLESYLEQLADGRLPVEETEYLTLAQQMAEMVMVGLRTREGMDIARFDTLSDIPFTRRFAALIQEIESQDLGAADARSDRFRLTLNGWACLDSIVESFVREIF